MDWIIWVRFVGGIVVRQGGQCDAERIKITLRILEIDEALNQILVFLGPAALISMLNNDESILTQKLESS